MSIIEVQKKDGQIFSYIRNKWLHYTPEEEVRQNLVCKLVNDFGYPLAVMSEEYRPDLETRGVRSTRADIVIFESQEKKDQDYNAFIVIECKAENVKIRLEDFYQGTEYAAKLRAQFLVLHNSKETNFYAVDMDKIPNKVDAFTQIVAIPHFSEIGDAQKIAEIKSQTKTFTREEFTRMLRTCHNIIRNNDKLSPEAAFDEISKILFMKIRYERDKRGSEVFTLKKFQQLEKDYEQYTRPTLRRQGVDLPYMQILFNDTKDIFKDDRLFDDNETIKIRQNSFEQILEKLQVYNLSDTQDDVKGIAFEHFLGTTFRGELGQYFTPRTIVDFMTNILDPKEGETICDPTCGSGGFLIKAFEYVREQIEEDIKNTKARLRSELEGKNYDMLSEKEQFAINERIEQMQSALNTELDTQVEGSRMYNLSRNCIYGTDANPRMARTSKMNMIMHGDGHGGVHHHDGLLNVNGIFEERFDVILTNPPFGSRIDKSQKVTEADRFTDEVLIAKYMAKYGDAYEKALKQVNDNIGKSLLSLYDVGSMSGLTEVWDVIGQGMILKSSRPLVVFEGKTDVMYVKRALDLLKQTVAKYNALSVDFLNANGAGNVKSFIENLNELVSTDKKIVVFFDRDNAGKDGAQSITGISKNDERIANYQDIVKGNLTVSFIPYKEGISDGDFLIEDYFSWDGTIKAIVEDIIPDQKHPIKCLPNLPNRIKAEIEKRINQFKTDEFNGFVPLLDKILELSQRNSD